MSSIWELPPKERAVAQHARTKRAARRMLTRDYLYIPPTPTVKPLIAIPDNLPTYKRIIYECSRQYFVEPQQVFGASRSFQVKLARHAAMYRMHTEMGSSLAQIGRWLNRDHTTVLSGIRAHKARMEAASMAWRTEHPESADALDRAGL